jgi:hypothetical protein
MKRVKVRDLRDTTAPDFVFVAKNSWRVSVTRKYWFDPARMRSLVAAQPRWDLRGKGGK